MEQVANTVESTQRTVEQLTEDLNDIVEDLGLLVRGTNVAPTAPHLHLQNNLDVHFLFDMVYLLTGGIDRC
jgi:hypothetical protein